MAILLGQAQHRDIRAALAPELADDTTRLPDDVIDMDIYAGMAESDVLDLDPDAETRTGEGYRRAVRAAVFFCAARLAPRFQEIARESFSGYSYGTVPRDFTKNAGELKYEAYQQIAMNLGVPLVDLIGTTTFTTAAGRRGYLAF